MTRWSMTVLIEAGSRADAETIRQAMLYPGPGAPRGGVVLASDLMTEAEVH